MDKVQKLINSECYTPSSEPIRIYLKIKKFLTGVTRRLKMYLKLKLGVLWKNLANDQTESDNTDKDFKNEYETTVFEGISPKYVSRANKSLAEEKQVPSVKLHQNVGERQDSAI
jgi:hypothetical protein